MSLNLDFISSEFNLSVGSSSKSKVYIFEGYRLDAQRKMLYRGECELVLPPKAIETLIALIELRGEIVSKGDLMKIIWVRHLDAELPSSRMPNATQMEKRVVGVSLYIHVRHIYMCVRNDESIRGSIPLAELDTMQQNYQTPHSCFDPTLQ